MDRSKKSVLIAGGGMAGLTAAILLNRKGFEVTLVEKKSYPFHRVCGEYVSNELLPFFSSLDIDMQSLQPSRISRLAISANSGRLFSTKLDLGGFGISRYTLDHHLFRKAASEGVNFLTGISVQNIEFCENRLVSSTSDNRQLIADYVISAHGKRSNLDKTRNFFYRRSPYLGVKYHVKTDFAPDLIQLDNFEGGYCGTVKVEGDKFCLCYLTHNHHLKRYGSIPEMEKNILFKNPHLKRRFLEAEFLMEKPEVINEISFAQKSPVEGHIFYCGDSAGMIAPLCGNGMAMAVRSAKILADTLAAGRQADRERSEELYSREWEKSFSRRLGFGRLTQSLLRSPFLSQVAVNSFSRAPGLANFIIRQTHGSPF